MNWKLSAIVVLFCVTVFGNPFTAISQQSAELTAADEQWIDQVIGVENSGIVNGVEYKISFSATGNPFYDAGEVNGIVRFAGHTYHVPLLYDIYRDELVVKHLGVKGVAWFVQLDKKAVDEFSFSNRVFRSFDRGYHEVMFEGNDFQLLAKRSKISLLNRGVPVYERHDEFFLLDSLGWKRITGKSGFRSLLADKQDRDSLNEFIRQNRLKLKKSREQDFVKAATYVNTLRSR
jgi:hypothetical protein